MSQEKQTKPISARRLAISLVLLLGIMVTVTARVGDLESFLGLFLEARASWLFLAVTLQILTYILTGWIWIIVGASSSFFLKVKSVSLLALEQLAIDNFIPIGGIAGNTLIVGSLTALGLPSTVAMEAVLVSILSFHIAYSIVSAIAVAILWFFAGITPIIAVVVSAYFLVSIIVTVTVLLIIFKKLQHIPIWFKKRRIVTVVLEAFKHISPERVLSPSILTRTSALRIAVFLLDTATLWAVMYSLGVPISMMVAFVALVLGTIAGNITFLPGGVIGFEAGAIAVMLLFGVPTEAAFAGTILLRGLTLWLPLVPGIYLVRHHLNPVR